MIQFIKKNIWKATLTLFKLLVLTSFWLSSLRAYESTMEFWRNKAMYKEGEDRYLKDLDWVNMVKSIRELKALTRIILSQQQRQILAFERESVLLSSKYLEELDVNQIQNKVPFEYGSREKHEQYSDELQKIIEHFSSRPLTNIDNNIINDVPTCTPIPLHPYRGTFNEILS